jgi:hypothetical protein
LELSYIEITVHPLLWILPAKDMAAIGNKLYRGASLKQEESLDIDKQLARIDDDMRKLKIDFDIYLNGATKRPPLEQRARLDSMIKRMADNRTFTYAQRFQFNALVSRFTSYRELWRRALKAKGEELM